MPRHPRSRRDRADRRKAIIEIATDVFLEHGFEAASMSMVAERVGGSKATLYNYFKSKEEIFSACMRLYDERRAEAFTMHFDGGEPAAALARLGRDYLAATLSESNVRHVRLVLSAARRMPQIGRAYHEAVVIRDTERLVAVLERMKPGGNVAGEDAAVAARNFIILCQGWLLNACLIDGGEVAEALASKSDAAVEVFIAAVRRAAPPLRESISPM